MNGGARILIVEDEEQLARMLRSALIQGGYAVSTARTGGDALDLLRHQRFDVILLDLGLPDFDGKDVIPAARALTAAPILVISARDSGNEKIAALDIGASDYVPKPFDTGELLARIRVALRPVRPARNARVIDPALELDFAARRAVVNNSPVRLSRKEAELLRLLADAEGSVVSHDEIIEAVWGKHNGADLMNLRVLAWQVRRKIEPDPASPSFLISEAGIGYRLILKTGPYAAAG
jgi:two-component system KDP operon response regulator KdpE